MTYRACALNRSFSRALLVALAVALSTLAGTGGQRAWAGGFEYPDNGTRAVGRGGAVAVGVNDLTAIHYNPGALARLGGSRLMWHHNLAFHDMRFNRAPVTGFGKDAGTEFDAADESSDLFAKGGFVAAASDFGLDDFMFAFGVYGPSSIGRLDYTDYGPQSFMLTEMDVLVLYYSLSAAWQIPDKLGIGLTLQWVDVPRMDYELVIDATSTESAAQLDPMPSEATTQILTNLQLEDRASWAAIAGAWYRPWRFLELGLASRFVPAYIQAKGSVEVDKPSLVTDDLTAEMEYQMPVQVRGGVRYIHESGDREQFDLELDVFWENWSAIDAYDMKFHGAISGQEVQDLSMQKAWRDTVSVRIGSDINVVDDHLKARVGGFWESGAVPENYEHLDFPSFDRFGLGAGLTGTFGAISLSVAYMHIFQEDREVSALHAKQFQQRPLNPCPDRCSGYSGVPANAGTFESSYDIVSVGLDVAISELF